MINLALGEAGFADSNFTLDWAAENGGSVVNICNLTCRYKLASSRAADNNLRRRTVASHARGVAVGGRASVTVGRQLSPLFSKHADKRNFLMLARRRCFANKLVLGALAPAKPSQSTDRAPPKHAVHWSIEMHLSSAVERAKLRQLADLGTYV
jgi:hypothetical protein